MGGEGGQGRGGRGGRGERGERGRAEIRYPADHHGQPGVQGGRQGRQRGEGGMEGAMKDIADSRWGVSGATPHCFVMHWLAGYRSNNYEAKTILEQPSSASTSFVPHLSMTYNLWQWFSTCLKLMTHTSVNDAFIVCVYRP